MNNILKGVGYSIVVAGWSVLIYVSFFYENPIRVGSCYNHGYTSSIKITSVVKNNEDEVEIEYDYISEKLLWFEETKAFMTEQELRDSNWNLTYCTLFNELKENATQIRKDIELQRRLETIEKNIKD